MRKITKDNDLILSPDLKDSQGNQIPFTAFKSVTYTLYTTADAYTYTVTDENLIDGKIYIPSDIVANFDSGIMKYDIHLAIADTNFSDGTHDIYLHNKMTNIYLV